LAENESLGAELLAEKKEEQRLLEGMATVISETRQAQDRAAAIQTTLSNLEARRTDLAWRVGLVRALEGEIHSFYTGFIDKMALLQERYRREMGEEMEKAAGTHARLMEVRRELKVAAKGVRSAKEDCLEAEKRLEMIEKERDMFSEELGAGQEETRRLVGEMKAMDKEITGTEETVSELETYTTAIRDARMRIAGDRGGLGGGKE
jgi:chromosome segregation ATPase